MRILLINQYAVPAGSAGITRHAVLTSIMLELGIETTIIASERHYWNLPSPEDAKTESATQEVKFSLIPGRGSQSNGIRRVSNMISFSIRAFWRGTNLHPRPDIVLGSSPHLFGGITAWLLAKRFKTPFVLEVRDLWPLSIQSLLGLSRWHPIVIAFRLIERFLYRRADLVVTLLPGSEQHIRTLAPKVRRIVWIPNGVDARKTPKPIPLPRGIFTVIYAGAHGVPNNLNVLLDAAHLLELGVVATSRPVRFVLIGDGKEKRHLIDKAKQLELRSVEFRDAVPKRDIQSLLAQAHLLVVTAQDTDLYQFGTSLNKVFDYFASARPIIFGLKTPRDPINESGAGWTVPPDDAVALANAIATATVLTNVQLAEIGQRGPGYVKAHHDLERLAKQLAKEVQVLIE